MTDRVVVPEWLDRLPATDPLAQRSRRDLRRINALMGNDRWILQELTKLARYAARGISEIGAGDGSLLQRIRRRFPEIALHAYDLVPRPEKLDPSIIWHSGDLFTQPKPKGGILIANLFLHHFEGDALRKLGDCCEGFDAFVFNEPDRARICHWFGSLLHPFINRVTRHDMHVSIRAGFSQGELPAALGLDPSIWRLEETSTWRGGRHVVGWRA